MTLSLLRNVVRALSALALITLVACAPRPRGASPVVSIDHALAAASTADSRPAPPPAVPSAVSSALLPTVGVGNVASSTPAEPRFDISADNTPARDFFMGLVKGTPYNMVVHPDVTGKITLHLRNVTVPEVMKTVHDVYGYEYRHGAAGFEVMPVGLQTKMFYVNYLDITRKGRSETRVSSGQVTDVGNNNNNTTTNNQTTTTNGNGRDTVASSLIDTESKTDFWKDLSTALHTIVGNADGRQVVIEAQAGLVLVRAMPEELNQIRRYLAAIQGNLQREVILEAKILEVTLNDGFQSGINWAALAEPHKNSSVVIGQTGGGTIFANGSSDIAGVTNVLNSLPNSSGTNNANLAGTAASAFGGVFSAALNFRDFTAFIELLENQGRVQVLSSPRVATVNNQKAVIKVGSDEFFVTNVSSTTVTGTTTTTTPNITLTPFFSGIALDVTPQISPEGQVILHIHPTVSNVTDQTKNITVAGQEQSLPLAYSTVRESDSIVSARSGQVVVIGGLMQTKNTKQRAAIPYLGRIPVVGSLFRQNQTASQKSELVILLRPVVVDNSGAWNSALKTGRSRFNALNHAADGRWQGGLRPMSGE